MKREIKFRVWSKSQQYMDFPTSITIDDSGHVEGVRGYGDEYPYTDIELMQYTGLRDKNGREICESDIVRVWDNGTAVVKFDESLDRGQWMCEFIPDDHNAETWSAPLFDWLDGNVDGSVFEILGNIYEHPELLEADIQ